MSSPLILCPHCHTPVDPASMDTAHSRAGDWRICPACDEPVLFEAAPTTAGGVGHATLAPPVEV